MSFLRIRLSRCIWNASRRGRKHFFPRCGTLGGIYQVRAYAFVAAGGSDERYYVWNADEDTDIGFKRKGDVKAFGVCDEQWQIDLRNCAKARIDDASYGYSVDVGAEYGFSKIPLPLPKCSIFVAHMIKTADLFCPVQRRGRYYLKSYPPLANDWDSEVVQIEHWTRLQDGTFPQPGFVAAIHGEPIGQ